MDQLNSTTQHQKGKHLSFEERVIIQTRLNDKHSPNKIAAELGCSPNTVRNEIKRGTIYLYNGKVARYKADAGQKVYEENRANSCRRCEYINKLEFIAHVENSFFELGISIDACVGEAMEKGYFPREQMLCSKTIYNYIDKGLMRIRTAITIFQRKYLVDLSSKECEKTRSYLEGRLKKGQISTTN